MKRAGATHKQLVTWAVLQLSLQVTKVDKQVLITLVHLSHRVGTYVHQYMENCSCFGVDCTAARCVQ